MNVLFNGDVVSLQLMQEKHSQNLYRIVESNPSIWTYLPIQMDHELDMHRLVIHSIQSYWSGKEIPFVVYHKEMTRL